MASRMVVDKIASGGIQRYHHSVINRFGEHETLVDAVTNRPGFFGPNPVAYLSIMVRRPSSHPGDLEEALLNDRSLIRVSAFRASLFLIGTSDYPIYFRALYPLLRSNSLNKLEQAGLSENTLIKWGKILSEINFQMPASHEQVIAWLYPAKEKLPEIDLQRLILRKLCDFGILIRIHAKGWKGNDFSYALLKNWLSDLRLSHENPESARTETIRRYLKCYGPASVDDMAWWTGLPATQISRSVSHLRREAVRIPLEGHKEEMYALRGCVDDMRKPPECENHILFLPPWDPYPLAWHNRKRIIDRELADWVYDAIGNASGTIVENGRIVGVWQFRDSQTNVFELHIFEPYLSVRREILKQAEEHANTLATLSSATTVNLFERPLPAKLTTRPLGSFLWPLGKELPFKSPDERLMESPMERRTSNTFRGRYLDSEHVLRTE